VGPSARTGAITGAGPPGGVGTPGHAPSHTPLGEVPKPPQICSFARVEQLSRIGCATGAHSHAVSSMLSGTL
jgi:hypothetical protein